MGAAKREQEPEQEPDCMGRWDGLEWDGLEWIGMGWVQQDRVE